MKTFLILLTSFLSLQATAKLVCVNMNDDEGVKYESAQPMGDGYIIFTNPKIMTSEGKFETFEPPQMDGIFCDRLGLDRISTDVKTTFWGNLYVSKLVCKTRRNQ